MVSWVSEVVRNTSRGRAPSEEWAERRNYCCHNLLMIPCVFLLTEGFAHYEKRL